MAFGCSLEDASAREKAIRIACAGRSKKSFRNSSLDVSVSVRKHVESSESFVIQGRRSESEGAPMWTKENRGRYDRSRLRYPSDLTDEEWALVEPLIASAKRGGTSARWMCVRWSMV